MKTITATLAAFAAATDAHAHLPDEGSGIAMQFGHAFLAAHHVLPALVSALAAAAIVLLLKRGVRRRPRG